MYSVIVGDSPQTGHSGSLRSATSVNDGASASKSSSRPVSRSPMPSASLSASFAWSEPMMPGQDSEHAALGAARRELRRRRLWEEAAVARPLAGLEDGHLALEAEDRAVDRRGCRATRTRRSRGNASGSCRRRRRSTSQPSPRMRSTFSDVRRSRKTRTLTSGFSASIVRLADSTFGSPSRSVEWTIWRWRFDASTASSSTIPSVPTPAAAR